jgi:error-prone DNA polymerase
MERLRNRFFHGAAANGITGDLADMIFGQIEAFSGYGFPEAHSMSFALLVYASAYLKLYYPAAFCAGLLRAQPMGFYSPQSLVADARRHGVTILRPNINHSLAHATLEPHPDSTGDVAVRLDLGTIRNLGTDAAQSLIDERDSHGPYHDMEDLGRRTNLTEPQLEALATSGAFDTFDVDRRQALWTAGAVARDRPHYLPGTTTAGQAPSLPGMSAIELTVADVWATGITPDRHPVEFLRHHLNQLGALPPRRSPTSRTAPASSSAAPSPTANDPPPQEASPSSTSKTKPACSTSSAAQASGPDTANSPATPPHSSSAAPSKTHTASAASTPTTSKPSTSTPHTDPETSDESLRKATVVGSQS